MGMVFGVWIGVVDKQGEFNRSDGFCGGFGVSTILCETIGSWQVLAFGRMFSQECWT
jgi:hypothetical protein